MISAAYRRKSIHYYVMQVAYLSIRKVLDLLLFLVVARLSFADDSNCDHALQIMPKGMREAVGSQKQISIFRQAVLQCDSVAAMKYNLAVSLLAQGNVEEAVFLLRNASKQTTEQDVLRSIKLAIGKALLLKGDLDAAKQEYQTLFNENPEDIEPVLGLAIVNFKQNNLESAEALLKKANNQNPEHAIAAVNYGILQQKKGKLSDAIEIFTRIAQNSRGDTSVNLRLVTALLEAGRLDEAGQVLSLLAVRVHNDAAILAYQGLVLQQKDKDEEAEKVLEKAKSLSAKNKVTLATLAIVKYNLGKKQEAHFLIDEMLLYYSDDIPVLNSVAWLLIKMDEVKKAEELLLKVVALDTTNRQAHTYLAELYENFYVDKNKAEEHRKIGEGR